LLNVLLQIANKLGLSNNNNNGFSDIGLSLPLRYSTCKNMKFAKHIHAWGNELLERERERGRERKRERERVSPCDT
jgi:hypothetical protein